MKQGNLEEMAFNLELARAFRRVRRRWSDDNVKAEDRIGQKRIDIRIGLHGTEVAVETEWDSKAYPGNEDAKVRLDQYKDFRAAIAVSIPKDLRNSVEDSIQKALVEDKVKLGYAAFQRIGIGNQILRTPEEGYLYGNTNDLADFITMASVSEKETEEYAQKLSDLIGKSARELYKSMSKAEQQELISRINHEWEMGDLKIIVLLWYNALATHKHLDGHSSAQNNKLPPFPELPKRKDEPLNLQDLIEDWRLILDANWKPVFKPAFTSLCYAYSRQPKETAYIITKLYRQVLESQTKGIGEQVNMCGELYQRILPERKETAAFYTAAPIAELLSHLTIREKDRKDWGNVNLFENLRIADLACGTGTLLRAGYLRVKQLHERKNKTSNLGLFHKHAMEKGIVGADINRISSHLSNTSMAAVGEGEPYKKTQIAHVEVGKNGSTGSLEFLEGNFLSDLQLYDKSESMHGTKGKEKNIDVPNASQDYILMNPPYSRTRGGQSAFDLPHLKDEERKDCQRRWGILNENFAKKFGKKYAPNKKAGMASSFLSIALNKIKPGGRIGYVLPLTAAFSTSWQNTRIMLEQEFEDIIVITGKKGRISDETNMNEMLLVATRRTKPKTNSEPTPIQCVNIDAMPSHIGVAAEVARAILSALSELEGDSREIGFGKTRRGHISSKIGHVLRFHGQDGQP
ncbi:MAG: N-6 DNA methylase, partial [Cytophagales bacterium]|nr:N-6 DNA methylase [Cytophagales bacterium]